MNWAWHQALKPVPKLVLMALADAADDQGICWPSVATLASKVGVSTRTVRRVMQELISGKFLAAEQRYRSDGSCSSNRYRLSLAGGDKLSPAPDASDTTPGHTCQGAPDTSVIPGTTIRTQKESPQLLTSKTRPADRGGGALSDLDYPKALLPAERSRAEAMVTLTTHTAQPAGIGRMGGDYYRRRDTRFIARLPACTGKARSAGHLRAGACFARGAGPQGAATGRGCTRASRVARAGAD